MEGKENLVLVVLVLLVLVDLDLDLLGSELRNHNISEGIAEDLFFIFFNIIKK